MMKRDDGGGPGAVDHRHDEMIRADAYFRWKRSGQPDGMDVRFWLDAERKYVNQHPVESTLSDTLQEASTEMFETCDMAGVQMPGRITSDAMTV